MTPCTHRRQELSPVSICRRTRTGPKIRQSYAVFDCALHGRCLPTLRRWQPQHEQAEATLYKLCLACPDRSPPPPG